MSTSGCWVPGSSATWPMRSLTLCVTDDEGIREITASADNTAAFRPGLIAISHGIGDAQLHERGRHAASRFAGTEHLLARPAGARS